MVIKLNFVQTLSTRFGQEFEVEVQAKLLKLKFGQYFAADFWLRLQSWILVNILKLGLVKIFTLDLVELLIFG